MGNLKHHRMTTSKHPGVKFGDKWKEGKAKTKKMELNLLFLVSNGKSDRSVLKFKEQHSQMQWWLRAILNMHHKT